MAAKTNVTTTAQFTTSAREVDFVTRFADNWDALRTILGIMRPIRKAPGTKLVSYKASVDGGLKGGAVAEGDEIPFTKMKVEPVAYGDIEVAKYTFQEMYRWYGLGEGVGYAGLSTRTEMDELESMINSEVQKLPHIKYNNGYLVKMFQ